MDVPHESIEVEKILALSLAAPPELAADLRLQLVEKGLLRTKLVQSQALQDAFDLANGAIFKLPLTSTHMGAAIYTDSDAGMLSSALALHLDAFSLKLRAIQAFLHSDPKRAFDAFQSIPDPQIPKLACKDAMGYSLDLYYTTLAALYKGAFNAEDRKKERDQEFLLTHLARYGTAFAMEPSAKLLNTIHLSKEQFSDAMAHFAQALANVPDDDRSFTAVTTYSLMDEIFSLAQSAQRNGLPIYQLIFSLGGYLLDHLHTTRCADSASSGFYLALDKTIMNDFNGRFHSLGSGTQDIPFVTLEDSKPTALGGKVEVYAYWDKPDVRAMMDHYKLLRFGSPEEQSTDPQPTSRDNMAAYLGRTQRNRDEWMTRATDYLHSLDEWDVSTEPEIAAFHQKCLGYDGLLAIVPKSNLRLTIFTEYLQFLRDSPIQRNSPPEWALHLVRLLQEKFEEKDEIEFQRVISQSSNATMQAYADLFALTPASH